MDQGSAHALLSELIVSSHAGSDDFTSTGLQLVLLAVTFPLLEALTQQPSTRTSL